MIKHFAISRDKDKGVNKIKVKGLISKLHLFPLIWITRLTACNFFLLGTRSVKFTAPDGGFLLVNIMLRSFWQGLHTESSGQIALNYNLMLSIDITDVTVIGLVLPEIICF